MTHFCITCILLNLCMIGIYPWLNWGKSLQNKKYTLNRWYSFDIQIRLCCIINKRLNRLQNMNSCIQGMWCHHCSDCILSWLMSIESMLKDWPNNTQLHITDIKCYCTHSNKEQDLHNHYILCHSKKTYCCKKHNCLGLFKNTHHILIVCIDGICCHLCRGKIRLGIVCRKMESYSKYNPKAQINKSDMCCQYRGNTLPDIVNIGCCWDNTNIRECYQNRSNICDHCFKGSNCLGRQGKLMKSCIVDSRGC